MLLLLRVLKCLEKFLDEGRAGENCGLLLRGIEKDRIKRGMVIAKPASITPHAKFKAEVYILKERRRWKTHSIS